MKALYVVPYFTAMAVEVVIRIPYARQRRAIARLEQRVSLAERILLALLSVTMLVLPALFALTPWLHFADYGWAPPASILSGAGGLAFLASAIWVFWRAHRDLGANWSPSLEISVQHTLVTDGVYGALRHPMYASQLLWCVGQGLLLQNWIAGPAGIAAFVPLYLVRVPTEERMMLEHFGEAYRSYSERTGRILPRQPR